MGHRPTPAWVTASLRKVLGKQLVMERVLQMRGTEIEPKANCSGGSEGGSVMRLAEIVLKEITRNSQASFAEAAV